MAFVSSNGRLGCQWVQTGDMGYRIVRVHRLHLHSLTSQSSSFILDAAQPLMEATEFHSSKVQIPLPIVDLLEADVLAAEHMADVHPAA